MNTLKKEYSTDKYKYDTVDSAIGRAMLEFSRLPQGKVKSIEVSYEIHDALVTMEPTSISCNTDTSSASFSVGGTKCRIEVDPLLPADAFRIVGTVVPPTESVGTVVPPTESETTMRCRRRYLALWKLSLRRWRQVATAAKRYEKLLAVQCRQDWLREDSLVALNKARELIAISRERRDAERKVGRIKCKINELAEEAATLGTEKTPQ